VIKSRIGTGKGSSSWVRRQSENTQAAGQTLHVPVTLDLLNPKSTGFDRLWILCKVSSHSDREFSFFFVLTHIHIYTHREKVIAISAPPYFVVGADNNDEQIVKIGQQTPKTSQK